MEKAKKSEVMAKIKRCFKESEAVVVVSQNKMTVAETESLRKQLRSVDSCYLVAKNTLARLAVLDTAFECISEHFNGQMALVFSKNITGSAKVISEYAAKSDDKLVVVCGGFESRLLSASDIQMLAQLPPMNALRAKIVAVVQAPAQRMVTLLQAPACQIARVLKGYSEKQH
ncbi:MAG: 50S ribosomal protein L10 [Holosporaceae bacterium]|nr:50S ribosomal protein L10 [Holosporaceae bacterium]